ncbi:extracellular solute-binding protein [Actinospica durhamensis]|uniref:Extracellular solute-binding protein n=1 Tax=Actinospica durhamensis TaxID=1508375 RepID=A0A941EU76_9ACTN|nr:extracellular solute-binding protein [Actinospica durhamensis]MBR7836482.1 extracellular solute-binding protein [Actinospica durhamensis]
MYISRARGRSAAFAAALVATSLLATACSNTMGSAGSGDASADSSLFGGSAVTGVTLTLWHNTADPQALLDLYKAYEKESGNTLQFVDIPASTFPTTVQTKWATGARPDILEWHGNRTDLLALNGSQTMVDLSSMSFVAKEGQLATLSGSLDGKTYAATIGMPTVFGLFYNKSVLAAAGLSVPQTYADLAHDCTVLKAKEPGVIPLYEAGGSGWPQQVLSSFDYVAQYNKGNTYAASILSGEAKLNDPNGPLVKGLEAYAALKSAGCFNSDSATGTWETSLKDVLAGKAAMVANGSDSVPMLDADAGGNDASVDAAVGFTGVSATSAVAGYAPSPLGTYYVPKTGDTTKERAAIQFIEYVTGAGYGAYIDEAATIPTLSGTATPKMQGLMQQIDAAYRDGATLTWNSQVPGSGNFGPESAKLLAGQEDAQAVADKVQDYYLQASAAAGS